MSYYDNAVMMAYGLGIWGDERKRRPSRPRRGDDHRGRSPALRKPLHWF